MKKLIWLFCMVATAQTLTTETELANDKSLSHYFIYHQTSLCGMVFYHRPVQGKALIEVAGGPSWKWKKGSLDIYLGGANDGRAIAALVGVIKLPAKLEVVLISDPKIQTGLSVTATAWYNRLLVGRGWVWFRSDGFWMQHAGNLSRQYGIEFRVKLKNRFEIFSFPSGDAITKQAGITAGLRLKIF
jgi:hypothetical protein